jgi:hypothetical protein
MLHAYSRGAPEAVYRLSYIAAELTAERFALLATKGSIEALVRLDLASELLDSPSALGVCEAEYLKETERKVDALLAARRAFRSLKNANDAAICDLS